MEKPRQKAEKPPADNVAGAARRAYRLVNYTSKGTKSSSYDALLGRPFRRNRDLTIKAIQDALPGIGIVKTGSADTAKEVLKPKKAKKHRRPSLVEQIKAPMTKAEAQILSQRLNDPDRPKRKLPPRP
ncbi:hypothetical protein OG778_30280 [Streptomyces sp. NBC_00184]|uniref:hypothetical protein n=1 Tax=Streptomyces sp. NBC_00184 TaxID=2975673 RepID=UPI002E2D459E|nr:hypothetical protein [Streptomyces sp. NBC_00184]